jgi:AcrR family transcriptional regulator
MNQMVHPAARSRAARTPRAARERATTRTNDPERTMANILEVATQEFGEKGLAGARIDEIADATHTSKRMIYYYFGSKEGLYLAVLEESYRRMRQNEAALHLEDLPPEEALRRLVAYTFDHHHSNEPYIRLVMSENIHRGQYLAQSRFIQELNTPAITAIRQLYDRGVAEGVFRPGLDPLDIHWAISSLAFFNVSNRHTFDLIFKRDRPDTDTVTHRRALAVEMVVRYLRADR